MPNNILSKTAGLAITMSAAAALEAGRLVKISANNTFADAAAGDHVIGFTLKEAKAASDLIAVELFKYTKKIEIIASGALTAGGFVKNAAPSGANQRVTAWVQGTDVESLKTGVVLIGGADGATVTILA